MAKAAKKLPQPKQPINDSFIDTIDELHVARNMFECAYLAVGEAVVDTHGRDAIQSVMWKAQQTLQAAIAKVEAIQERSRKVQS